MLQFHRVRPNSIWVVAVAVAAAFGVTTRVGAADTCIPAVGRVVSVQGGVDIRRPQETSWQAAQLDRTVCPGDTVRVGERSRAALLLGNETTLRLDQNTSLIVAAPEDGKRSLLDLLRGAIHVITRTPKPFKVTTPFANAGVEGTEFAVDVGADGAKLAAFEGKVSVANEFGAVNLVAGELALVAQNMAPRNERLVRPVDAVQWALYYPNVMDSAVASGQGHDEAAPALRESIDLYRQGRLAEAIFSSDKLSKESSDARTLAYHAGLLLLVGRVDEAKPDIERALRLEPRYADAYALESVIALVQNDKAHAMQLATKAVELEATSSTAHMALSYVEQAHGRIDAALASARKATELEPKNALAEAHLAELYMAGGDLDRALAAAQRAAELDANLARTRAVLGFAQLTRMDTHAAKQSFRKAIALDQADPLPRLGLGLAEIREGDLSAGREEIEVAVSLDPGNSLIRSYMGKAYYEERRNALAGKQFDLAKTLDPNDPTPWLYDAIRMQSENRPGQALAELQKSIELNDNRAVYRSRLLLDQDLAMRSTSLARSYDDLGFERSAVVEASKSLALDPGSYSAHRFLSDGYAHSPRYEIARTSELLQAQLLQPININPVQPRLAIKGVDIGISVGPAQAAFNEFTPLFERNRPQLTVSGIGGNNWSWGDEAVLSGVFNRFSYSLGQFHYQSDGFRDGADVEHDIYDIFAQAALTPDLGAQIEYRHRISDQGDIRLDLDPAFVPIGRRTLDHDVGRVGLHFSLSPRSDFLLSFISSDRTETQRRQTDITTVTDKIRTKGNEGEGQYQFRHRNFNLVVGAGAYRASSDLEDTIATAATVLVFPSPFGDVILPVDASFTRSLSQFNIKGEDLYTYATLRAPASVLWTAGLAYETYKQSAPNIDIRRTNPKFGLRWDITDKLRLRAAYLRTLKRVLAVDQTLEPTQVAGFNQFYDDFNGTQANLSGVGIDATLGHGFTAGAEATERRLTQPNQISTAAGNAIQFSNRKEYMARGYLYWTFDPSWSLTSEYRVERDRLSIDLDTTEIPIALRYFASYGIFGQIGPTFVTQNERASDGRRFSDRFTVVNAALGYRLPRRLGMVDIEVANLFNQDFRFKDASYKTSDQFDLVRPYVPGRSVMLRLTLNW